ncbi:MAG: bifunctional riboflavin kinase/FAD synthetase [Promicromonosporaceae bacterium]|nr:bifunctional riboflavin kinase/FAD synthetase [Promicromonosporaceae bacterium]
MLIWKDLSAVAVPGHAVVTIGNFDGVHVGHQAVLRRVGELAGGKALSVAVTFDPHPVALHHPARLQPSLTTLDERLRLLAATGLDATLVINYCREFAALTPAAFAADYLHTALKAKAVVLGHDARFGADNRGTVDTLRGLGAELGFTVETVDDVGDGGAGPGGVGPAGSRVSSSQIRRLLLEGEVAAAARLLGRPYALRAPVVRGDARGRTIGFPTANLGPVETVIPADGVYAGWLAGLPAAISIGTNPTFTDGPERRVEAYAIDRDDLDLYDQAVTVEFAQRLRGTHKFDGVEALIAQMNDDVARGRKILL